MIVNGFTRWLATRAARWANGVSGRREPDVVIGGRKRPYLLRWWLIPRNPLFNIYLHVFHRDDDDRALHDHPWPSLSLSIGMRDGLQGDGLLEIYRDRAGGEVVRAVPFGALVWRGARFAHRLAVPAPGTMTIFITGPRVRSWGFHCPNGWRHWREFTSPSDRGDVGRGCE